MTQFSHWLYEQDVSIQYIYDKLILNKNNQEKQSLIAKEGYGKYILSKQNSNGHWGKYYYQPKWTSTHYTLLQLKELGLPPNNSNCRKIIQQMFSECQLENGGLNLAKSDLPSDICVDGMILNYSSYFLADDNRLFLLIDSILQNQKNDGGFTWHEKDSGDPHSTICILEGLVSFISYVEAPYRRNDIEKTIEKGLTYFYQNNLFLDEKKYQKMIYPFRYFYSIFRFLLFVASLNVSNNPSLNEAITWFTKKEPYSFINLEGEHRGEQFLHFSEKKEINPFLTVYGEFVRKSFLSDKQINQATIKKETHE